MLGGLFDMGDCWEWDLADSGVTIRARVSLPERIESVWMGPRLVSRSQAGGKGADHIVQLPPPTKAPPPSDVYRASAPPSQVELTFDPVGTVCTLRTDGKIMPPTREPDGAIDALSPESAARLAALAVAPLPERRWFGLTKKQLSFGAVVTASILAVVIAPFAIRRMKVNSARAAIAAAPTETELTETARAPDYSIAAHYPSDFEPTIDEQGATISLHRTKKLEMIVLMSMPRPDLSDPRDLDRIMMKELTEFTTKSGAKMSMPITRDEMCRGFPGISSTATLTNKDAKEDVDLKVVSCSALYGGRGYFFAYFLPEFNVDNEEAALRAIVDATDVFELPPTPAYAGNGYDRDDPPRGRVTFSAHGSLRGQDTPFGSDIPRAVPTQTNDAPRITSSPPPRPFAAMRPNPNLPPTPAPANTLQFNANGSVERNGNGPTNGSSNSSPSHHSSNKNRSRVPW